MSSLHPGWQSLQILSDCVNNKRSMELLPSSVSSGYRSLQHAQIAGIYRRGMENGNYDAISVKTYTLQSILPCDALLPKLLSECMLCLCSRQLFVAASATVCLSKARFLEGPQCNLSDVLLHYTMVCGLSAGTDVRKLCPAAVCRG